MLAILMVALLMLYLDWLESPADHVSTVLLELWYCFSGVLGLLEALG